MLVARYDAIQALYAERSASCDKLSHFGFFQYGELDSLYRISEENDSLRVAAVDLFEVL